jgi:hypothetical protein
VAAVSTDEDGIGGCDGIAANRTEVADVDVAEVADVDVDAWGAETAGIFMDDGFALRANLEGFYL